jgi:hypothetical protein
MVLAPETKALLRREIHPAEASESSAAKESRPHASHVIRPAGRRPPPRQRLATRRIAGRDTMTQSGRHRWPSTEPPLPYIAATSAELDSALAAEREAGWRTGQLNLPTAAPAMATSARHRGDSSTRSRRKHLVR